MERLKNISKTILEKRKKTLEEKQVFIFFEGILDIIHSNKTDEFYKKLSDYIHEMWQYRNIKDMDPEQAFLYGSIWGAINLEELNRKRIEMNNILDKITSNFRNYYPILSAIHNEVGITHKKLAGVLGKTPSDLSQIISRIYDERVFTYSRTGREKNYYLGQYGELVYQRLLKEMKNA